MSFVENLQRIEKFFAEIGAAAAVKRQRGERIDHVEPPGEASEVGLDPPQGDDEAGLDAHALADGLEKSPMLGVDLTPLLHPRRRHDPLGILRKGQREFRLPAVEFDHPWNGIDSCQGLVEDCRENPLFDALRTDAVEPNAPGLHIKGDGFLLRRPSRRSREPHQHAEHLSKSPHALLLAIHRFHSAPGRTALVLPRTRYTTSPIHSRIARCADPARPIKSQSSVNPGIVAPWL